MWLVEIRKISIYQIIGFYVCNNINVTICRMCLIVWGYALCEGGTVSDSRYSLWYALIISMLRYRIDCQRMHTGEDMKWVGKSREKGKKTNRAKGWLWFFDTRYVQISWIVYEWGRWRHTFKHRKPNPEFISPIQNPRRSSCIIYFRTLPGQYR